MEIIERELRVPVPLSSASILEQLSRSVTTKLGASETPVRFTVPASNESEYCCEVGVLSDETNKFAGQMGRLFKFRRRESEVTDKFNTVFLVPTGIGAEIGGHAGDSTAVARLLAESCDTLVIHPNVVNASDINEMPANSLYVEGSVISRMLMGTAGLQPVRSNRVLVVLDEHRSRHFVDVAINSVSAARAIYGLDCAEVVRLDPPVVMEAYYSDSGVAVGRVTGGFEHCLNVLEDARGTFDAIAFSSVIRVPFDFHLSYFKSGGEMVNPWGGVEAMLTHTVSSIFNVPTGHSPMFENQDVENLETGIVDPRMSAEAVSVAFLQCILKGLQRSPKIVTDEKIMTRPGIFSVEDVSCLVIPDGCLGLPTLAALEQGIPVIAVRENANLMRNDLSRLPWKSGQLFQVENYLEAAGVMSVLKAGVTIDSIRRPFSRTRTRTAVEAGSEAATKITDRSSQSAQSTGTDEASKEPRKAGS